MINTSHSARLCVASFVVVSAELPKNYIRLPNAGLPHSPLIHGAEEEGQEGHTVCSSNATINPGWARHGSSGLPRTGAVMNRPELPLVQGNSDSPFPR